MWAQITGYIPDQGGRLDGNTFTFAMVDQDMVCFQSSISDVTAQYLVDYEQMGDSRGSVFRQMISAIFNSVDNALLVGRQFSDEFGVGEIFGKKPPLNTKVYSNVTHNKWCGKMFTAMQDAVIEAAKLLHEQPVPCAFVFEGGAIWLEVNEENGKAIPVIGHQHPDLVDPNDENGLGGMHAIDFEGLGIEDFSKIYTGVTQALTTGVSQHLIYVSRKIPTYEGYAK